MTNDKLTPKIRFKGFSDPWEQRKFKKFTKSFSGGTPSVTISEYYGGTIPFIRSAEINKTKTKLFLTEQGVLDSSAKMVSKGTILYALYGATSGEVGISKINGAINQAILAILQTKDDDVYFIIQWLRLNKARIIGKYLQGGQGNLSGKIVNNLIMDKPIETEEEMKIGSLVQKTDDLIAANEDKLKQLKGVKRLMMQKIFSQEWRFKGFTDPWEQRKLGKLFSRRSERNNGQFSKNKWISVAKMYFQDADKVQSNNINTRTYVFRKGDIAFEGHPNKVFAFGRFVENDIGDGIISELFPIYRHIVPYDIKFWKYAIHREDAMHSIIAHSLTSSGNSSNKIDEKDFLRQFIAIPDPDEQTAIGDILEHIDTLIAANVRQCKVQSTLRLFIIKKIY